MATTTQKIYCFADEIGQDTKGEMFLVTVVLKDGKRVDELRRSIENSEHASGKHSRKWTKTSDSTKQKFLLLENKQLQGLIFYSTYHATKDYTPLVALTIAKSIGYFANGSYAATVVIDGLQDAEVEHVRRELKNLSIRYARIRGMKDEQETLLRLADSVAGFVRDHVEGQVYTKKIFIELVRRKIIREI